ncbi:hypothetical protein BIV60_12500 [Bacillus sp. MUM 116]|nr:hypothetical protein BIV60_12500 [Bacillus sp. MUM 116]
MNAHAFVGLCSFVIAGRAKITGEDEVASFQGCWKDKNCWKVEKVSSRVAGKTKIVRKTKKRPSRA